MRKTNVFLEVEDRVYELVIVPHKREKTFSKLVAALLKGYIEDEYVRAFGDETIGDMRKASVDSLESILDGMHESMSNLGLLSDELEENTQKGKKFFEEKQSGEIPQEQDSEVKREVEGLKKDVSAIYGQNAQILQLLQQIVAGDVSSVVKATPHSKPFSGTEEKFGEPIRQFTSSNPDNATKSVENKVVESEPSEKEAVAAPTTQGVNMMMGLLQGNFKQF